MSIAVSILARSVDQAVAAAREEASQAALIELRLDHLEVADVERLAQPIRDLGKPVIAACHGQDAFGHFRGNDEARVELLRAAVRAGVHYVDVDWRLARAFGATGSGVRRIVSRHVADRTPSDVAAFHRDVRREAVGNDLIKLVAQAHCAEDAMRMLALLPQSRGDLIAFGAGEHGSFSRVLAPILGAPWVYAAPSAGARTGVEATAPGQWASSELHDAWPARGPTQATRIFAVVGKPIGHSLSPRVHRALMREAGLDAVYVACQADDFAAFLAACAELGFAGLSVTAPYKLEALRAADLVDVTSRDTGAANTLIRDGRRWRASNTDVLGVKRTLELAIPRSQRPARRYTAPYVLVLGAGGAARAVAVAARELGARCVIAARDPLRASEFAFGRASEAIAWEDVPRCDYDVLVNATPVGLAGSLRAPIPSAWLKKGRVVVDAVYRPLETELIASAKQRGLSTVDGGEWFVHQAAAQFELFTGVPANLDLVRTVFLAGVEHE